MLCFLLPSGAYLPFPVTKASLADRRMLHHWLCMPARQDMIHDVGLTRMNKHSARQHKLHSLKHQLQTACIAACDASKICLSRHMRQSKLQL